MFEIVISLLTPCCFRLRKIIQNANQESQKQIMIKLRKDYTGRICHTLQVDSCIR